MNESERECVRTRVRGGVREGNANESARGRGMRTSESERRERARGM